jgi:hypothetical protein
MNPKLKQIIKNKLSEDFSSVSIINYNGSIWFIDAKSKYWYLELYKKTKTLWWRLDFFEDFFLLFSMEQREFVPIIIEWVEEVLNAKVVSTVGNLPPSQVMVEKILGEVVSTQGTPASFRMEVEEVLKGESVSTHDSQLVDFILAEKVLKSEVVSTRRQKLRQETQVKEILDTVAVSDVNQMFILQALAQEVLKNS